MFADAGRDGPFIGHYVYAVTSPPFNWRVDINFSDVYDVEKGALTPITAAPSPDLSAFRARGGKIIQTHGWNDSVVPPDGSIGYFHALTQWEKLKTQPSSVVDKHIAKLTTQEVNAHSNAFGDRVRECHRRFMLPATGHCGGSSGPSSIGGGMPEPPKAYRTSDYHALSAVIKWVAQGVAPEKIIASRFDAAGLPIRQRPVCPYPAQAAFDGVGDLDNAASFSCVTPRLQDRIVDDGDLLHIRNAITQCALILPNR